MAAMVVCTCPSTKEETRHRQRQVWVVGWAVDACRLEEVDWRAWTAGDASVLVIRRWFGQDARDAAVHARTGSPGRTGYFRVSRGI